MLELAAEIDEGLSKAHDKGVDYRDLKPGNLMITEDGHVKSIGTVSYMSPEQARGESVDSRSDIFSFRILLYEMLSGRLPFQGKTGTDTLSAILRDSTPRLSELEPAARHQSLPR